MRGYGDLSVALSGRIWPLEVIEVEAFHLKGAQDGESDSASASLARRALKRQRGFGCTIGCLAVRGDFGGRAVLFFLNLPVVKRVGRFAACSQRG